MTNPLGTNLSISANGIAQITAILTGGPYKRAATKEAALKRFFAVAAEKGFGPEAVMFLESADPKAAIEKALADKAAAITPHVGATAAPEAIKSSPGLARLRASQVAADLRTSTLSDADAARAAVVAGKPTDRKAALDLGVEPEAKPAKAPKVKAEGTKARTKIDTTAKIVAVIENPKKSGSRSHARFALYAVGQTAETFIAACVAAGYPEAEAKADLSWDRRKGFIKFEEGKAA